MRNLTWLALAVWLMLPGSAWPEDAVLSLASPAGPGSGQANLVQGADGRVYLSWIEPDGDRGHTLRYSVLEAEGWSSPRTIRTGSRWFVNWADFPSMAVLDDGTLAAHWLVRTESRPYAYDVFISFSHDGGETWSEPVSPHDDGTPTEHGFVSLFASGPDLGAVWLDGREMASGADGHGHGNMTLRYASIDASGAAREERVLDAKVCECCQTSAAVSASGPIVVYRDRSDAEIRDISMIRRVDGRWSEPRAVSRDGWQINGCPVNGPAIAARGRQVAVAWFTSANDTASVRLSFSDDGGETMGPPVRVDDGDPLGRVDVELLDDGGALVVWLERRGEGAEIRARRVAPQGAAVASLRVAATSPSRSSGFPRIARSGERVIFAWTNGRVFTSELRLR